MTMSSDLHVSISTCIAKHQKHAPIQLAKNILHPNCKCVLNLNTWPVGGSIQLTHPNILPHHNTVNVHIQICYDMNTAVSLSNGPVNN